jgi:hypothetical protein
MFFVATLAYVIAILSSTQGDIVSYLAGMLHESGLDDIHDSMGPFLEGYGCDVALVEACGRAVMRCVKNGSGGESLNASKNVSNIGSDNGSYEGQFGVVKLKQGIVSLSSVLTDQSEAEIDANRYMWGQDK